MSKNQRMIVEAFAPPFLATVCLVVMSFRQASLSDVFLGFLPSLLVTYTFGIFPAFLYMVAMELWFHFGWRTRCGLLCTLAFSAFMGAVAAFLSIALVTPLAGSGSDGFYLFMPIGAFIGLLIGFYVGRKETSAA